MKYLVAVSGGIDSVVLLDVMIRSWKNAEGTRRKPSFSGGQSPPIIVAHFDHGIRPGPDSAADARFVEALAAKYGLKFTSTREELGKDASEELARSRRYTFLRSEARRYRAKIVTAHHAGDAVETVALNLSRGTGWRGLAVLDTPDISRPLLPYSKQQIREYALKRRLEWVEDSTNSSTAYLRNRLRRRIAAGVPMSDQQQILALRKEQLSLKKAIDEEVARLLNKQGDGYSRYFFSCIDPLAATELLQGVARQMLGHSLPRPQLSRALIAIKTARPGAVFPFGSAQLVINQRGFTVKTP